MKTIEWANNYAVCEDGRIFSIYKGIFLKPRFMKNGYGRVCLTLNNGTRKDFLIHRIVCSVFNGEAPVGKDCVNHKDGNKSNNAAINLEWVNYDENMEHASQCGLLKTQSQHIKKVNLSRRKAVAAYNDNGVEILRFDKIDDARKAGYSAVTHAIKKGIKSAGYIWKLL